MEMPLVPFDSQVLGQFFMLILIKFAHFLYPRISFNVTITLKLNSLIVFDFWWTLNIGGPSNHNVKAHNNGWMWYIHWIHANKRKSNLNKSNCVHRQHNFCFISKSHKFHLFSLWINSDMKLVTRNVFGFMTFRSSIFFLQLEPLFIHKSKKDLACLFCHEWCYLIFTYILQNLIRWALVRCGRQKIIEISFVLSKSEKIYYTFPTNANPMVVYS